MKNSEILFRYAEGRRAAMVAVLDQTEVLLRDGSVPFDSVKTLPKPPFDVLIAELAASDDARLLLTLLDAKYPALKLLTKTGMEAVGNLSQTCNERICKLRKGGS
jgi:hypothetical protein